MGQFSKRLGRRKSPPLRVPKAPGPGVDRQDAVVEASKPFVRRPDGGLALRLVVAAGALLDQRGDEVAERERRACARGCDHCCHMPVTASVPEALLVRTYLRETWGADELRALTLGLRETLARQAAMDDDELARARERCALLADDGACRIYAVRPLACRGHASFSREACAASHEDPERDAEVPVDDELREHKDKVKTTVAITSELAGCVSLEYEFQSLLARLLEGEDREHVDRWLGGRFVLEDVRVLAANEDTHAQILELVDELV